MDDELFDSYILKTFIINVVFTIRYYFGEKGNHLTVSLNEIKQIHANKKWKMLKWWNFIIRVLLFLASCGPPSYITTTSNKILAIISI